MPLEPQVVQSSFPEYSVALRALIRRLLDDTLNEVSEVPSAHARRQIDLARRDPSIRDLVRLDQLVLIWELADEDIVMQLAVLAQVGRNRHRFGNANHSLSLQRSLFHYTHLPSPRLFPELFARVPL
jgi:hypothetical protein